MTGPLDLLSAAKCVLFDFDGPVCRLFSGHPAADVAAAMRALSRHRFGYDVPVLAASADDPHAVLGVAGRERPGSELVLELERLLTEEELRATSTAEPTVGAGRLMELLSAGGVRLAITTNNSPRAASQYLEDHGLSVYFDGHVHGRTADPALLKPNPHCLRRALETTGFTAEKSLMIGDSPADREAAGALGVPFLGYVRNDEKLRRLKGREPLVYIGSYGPLIEAFEARHRAE
ncbi:HAD family hydrolase [Streptomyces sp. NPDC006475]|uniref:HAD family hydrolase n=1 Tax=Streptomyces sp. NPDC006475 TaxID=3155719 RepID=UPI0033A1B4E5